MKVGDRKENDSDHYNIICNLERNVRLDRLIPGKQKIHHPLVMRERDQPQTSLERLLSRGNGKRESTKHLPLVIRGEKVKGNRPRRTLKSWSI